MHECSFISKWPLKWLQKSGRLQGACCFLPFEIVLLLVEDTLGRSGGRVQRPTRKWLLWLELYFALFQQVWRLFLMSYVKLVFLLHSFFIAGKESGVNLVYNSTDQSAKTPVFSRSFKKIPESQLVFWKVTRPATPQYHCPRVHCPSTSKKNCWTPLNKSANKEWRLYYVANGSKQCYT